MGRTKKVRTPTPPEMVTRHAIERFRERWPHVIRCNATCDLHKRLPTATFVAFEDGTDQEFWITYDGITLVVAKGDVKTVLPPDATKPEGRR